MARLIDVDALKKDWSMANKCEDCPRDARKCQFGMVLTRMDVCQMLDDAPTVGGWINIKDRLPEKSGWYLVSLINTRTGHRWEVPVSADYSHGKWDYAYLGGEDATWMLNNPVTHWMPLPEPPKEVQE